MSYSSTNYHKAGGSEWVVGSGGSLDIESGGSLKLAGTAIAATAAEIDETPLTLDIADGSADATYYLICPHAGVISKLYSVIDGVVSTADITITAKIGSTAITDGAITIATASSAAGDVDSATPSAANAVTAGAAINLVVAGGDSGGSPRIHVVVMLKRT